MHIIIVHMQKKFLLLAIEGIVGACLYLSACGKYLQLSMYGATRVALTCLLAGCQN